MKYHIEETTCGNCTPIEYFLEYNRLCDFYKRWINSDYMVFWNILYNKVMKKYLKSCLIMECNGGLISERLSLCFDCIEKCKNEYNKRD